MRGTTLEQWEKLSPEDRGYVWYMEAEWNAVLPRECPYSKESRGYPKFQRGVRKAILAVQEGDDE